MVVPPGAMVAGTVTIVVMRLAVAFSLLAYLGSVACAPALAADGRASLTVLSLNVLHGGPWTGFAGDGQQLERRMDLIAEEIVALRPDVIALQEAAVSRRLGNVPERLARRLGLHHVYAPATTRVFGDGILSRLVIRALGFHEGPAILSRFPIAEWDVSGLPRCEHMLDPRVLLRARLDTPWGAIDVFSTHTSRDDCQARRVTALVGQRRNGLPSVLMGDFNLGESSPAIRAMTEEAGFVDVYRHANPDALGPTARQPIDAPQPMARRRIDYIFLVPGLEVRGDVLRSRVVLDAPHRLPDGRTLWPSDHYGVIAELALSGAPGKPQ
jgi:endonuclease/exonuclease/phosphatase family metal-dependent hydrolase